MLFTLVSLLGIIFLLIIAIIYRANYLINKAAVGKLYSRVEDIPYRKVGLLLGTGKYVRKKIVNIYYKNRIEAAIALFNAGKIDSIIISGDNSRKDYNEPGMMKNDLTKAGIDGEKIYMDYAGFRTFDSIIRLKEIFEQTSATIISQPFHNARALYIAEREGIDAIAYNAKDFSYVLGIRVHIREKFARVKVFIDYWRGIKPKFLGEKIEIV